MADLKEKSISLLASTIVGMQVSDGLQTLYSVPQGKTAYISHVVVRDPTDSLAGGTSYDFTNWAQNVDLSGMTTANTDYIMVENNNTVYTELSEGTNFQIIANTGGGSIADANATIDVFGYLV